MAQFDITVNSPDGPIARSNSYEILPNTLKSLSILDNDYLGSGLDTLSIEIQASNGTAVVNGNNIDYTPNTGYIGTDSFYYKITDTNTAFDIAKVNITIG